MRFFLSGLVSFWAVVLLPLVVEAEKIVDSGCISVVTEGSDSFVVTVGDRSQRTPPKVEKMFLTNPSRAVLDLVGLKCSIARSIGLSDSGVVSTVRLGSHSDRVRLVFELLPSTKRNLAYSQSGEKIRIRIGGPDDGAIDFVESSTPMKPESSQGKVIDTTPKLVPSGDSSSPSDKKLPTSFEVVDSVIKEKKTADGGALNEVPQFHSADGEGSTSVAITNPIPDSAPVKTEPSPLEGKPTESAKAVEPGAGDKREALVPGRTEVRAIFFQLTKSGNAPAAVIDLSEVVPYILTKKREDLYEVDIDNAQLSGRHMLLPQFPPDNFTGFSAIIAQEITGKVTIQIFVEEGMQLLPFTAEGKLWVRIGRK